MANDRISVQREKLKSLLEGIIVNFNLINEEMEHEKHPRGIAQRSLKPKSRDYITHIVDKGITSFYTLDGKIYEINIHQI